MRRGGLVVAVLLLATACGGSSDDAKDPKTEATPAVDTGAAQPYVDGNRLVDRRDGSTFVPHGVNWSSFEYACTQGFGYSMLDTLAAADPADSEASAIAAWGADTVRLPLNQDCWLGTRGAPVSDSEVERTAEGYRAEVQDFVTKLHTHGLVVVLDLQSRKRAGTDDFGNLPMPDQESLEFWTSVATEYADDPSVLFDAFNEPYSRYDSSDQLVFDLTWDCWRDGGCQAPAVDDRTDPTGAPTYDVVGMAQVVQAIRDAGAPQPVLLGGLDYSNDLSGWLDHAPADDQLVASVHSYDFKECADVSCWDDVLAPLAEKVPVLTGELGADDPLAGYPATYLDWADAHGIGVLFWVWAAHADDPMSLLVETPGVATPWGELARARLMRD